QSFFFSSRRRHTRFSRDWSSDVCSSDLGTDFLVIEGEFEKAGRQEKIVCSYKKGNKKVIKRNDKPYERFSEHIGFLPLVIVSPRSEERRVGKACRSPMPCGLYTHKAAST